VVGGGGGGGGGAARRAGGRGGAHALSWVTNARKSLPTMQCQVGPYCLSNSFLIALEMFTSSLCCSVAACAVDMA